MDKKCACNDIIIENELLRLVIGSDCIAKSLVYKANGEECLAEGVELPLFTLTQDRPFNNEIKLAYPCKRMTFHGNRIRREGNQLIVGFNLIHYEAVLNITEAPQYIGVSLDKFINYEDGATGYGFLCMDAPPAVEFRLMQLAVRARKNFGDLLNVNWDEKAAINVLATAPETLVDATHHDGYRILFADVSKDRDLIGPGAALIVSSADQLLDAIADVEEDYDLPRGVESRRRPEINASIYWVGDLSLKNVDEHIQCAKTGGFRMMLLYYTCMYREVALYELTGEYKFNENYPNGWDDLRAVLAKIKAAGITPGLHFLHTHIGKDTQYVTPVADHRLNLKKHFTLAKPVGMEDTVIYVEQNPKNAPMAHGNRGKREFDCRVLQFDGELISYEGYTTEPPYCFTGCKRGYWNTYVKEHTAGQIGGVLDVSEYGAVSVYLDQDSSLADEVYTKLADTYNCGFEFIYFDGSEGTNLPYAYHIPNAQYRVYKKLNKKPLFTEGAAKAHFSWHMLSGGNAFDIFKPAIFKEMIKVHPAAEAPITRNDFTRCNFGWWAYFGTETQADMFEYGTSRAAAWDCPVTLQANRERFAESPRFTDVFEVLHRWEDARATGWLTEAQKDELKNLEQEHTLLVNEKKEFELAPYFKVEGAASGHQFITAYSFTRGGESYVVYWHHNDAVTLNLPLDGKDIQLVEELYEEPMAFEAADGCVKLPADKRRYVKSKLPVEALIEAFQKATVI